jgi:hypothetical protein
MTMFDMDGTKPFPWVIAILAATLAILAGLATLAYLRTLQSGKDVVEGTGQAVRDAVRDAARELPALAEKFRTGTSTTTFVEGLPRSDSTHGNILELATSETHEFFRREDSRQTLWGWLDLGTTVSEIRVPVTFRYHLKLSEQWLLTTRGNVCVVQAPVIRPSLPPAIHTDRLEKSSQSGWARFNKAENLAELEKQLTPLLNARAADPRHLRNVREECRKSVAEFIRNWLVREDHWRKDRFTAVMVVFQDELSRPDAKLELELENRSLLPTLSLDGLELQQR